MTDDRRPLKGELLPAQDEKLIQAIDKAKQQGISAQVAARISRSVFFNKITERRIRAGQAVIEAENDFMHSLIGHQKTRNRLLNLDIELEADALEQQIRRDEARQKADLLKLKGQIEREEAEQYLARLKRNREGSDDNSREKKNQREYEEAQQQAAHNARMHILHAKETMDMKRTLREERDRMIAEVTRGTPGQPTLDQQREIDDIHDYFQRVIDSL